jgi:hypothetical protein
VEAPQAVGVAAVAAVLAELAQTETLATTIALVTVVLVALRHCSLLRLRNLWVLVMSLVVLCISLAAVAAAQTLVELQVLADSVVAVLA